MSPFSVVLRNLREARGIRQKDAADLLGYEQSYLSAIETDGKAPPKKDFLEKVIQKYQLNESEQAELKAAFESSKRVIALPKHPSLDAYYIFNKLEKDFTTLTPQQIQIIKSTLDLGGFQM